jgi:hypothetical protein
MTCVYHNGERLPFLLISLSRPAPPPDERSLGPIKKNCGLRSQITAFQREAKAIPQLSDMDRTEIDDPDRVDCVELVSLGRLFGECHSLVFGVSLVLGSAIHSRMMFRRVSWSSMFAAPSFILISNGAARVHEPPPSVRLIVVKRV